MPAPTNLSYEIAGGARGAAQGWSLRSRSSVELHCGFHETEPADTASQPLTAPNDFTDGAWTTSELNVIADAAVAPDGSTTADQLVEDLTSDLHRISRAARTLVLGHTYTFGCFFKSATRGAGVRLKAVDSARRVLATADIIATGRVDLVFNDLGEVASYSAEIVDFDSGWFLLALSVRMSATASLIPEILILNDTVTGDAAYTGTGQSVYAWGAFFYEGELSAREGFESGWANDSFASEIIAGENGLAAAWDDATTLLKPAENFERAWGNSPYLTTITGSPALFEVDSGTEEFDGYEEQWANSPYLTTITGGVAMLLATTDDFEDFEDGWGVDPYLTTITGGGPADFDMPEGEAVEDFEEVRRDRDFTATASSAVLSSTAHGYSNGDRVNARVTGGELPAPLSRTTLYYVVSAAADTLSLSLTSGGAAITMTDAGSGAHTLRGAPSTFWNETSVNPTI